MKLQDLQEARYHQDHPVIEFIDDVEVDEIRSQTYPKDQWKSIFDAISRVWGQPKGELSKDYIYWTGTEDDTYHNIALQHKDAYSVHIEVSKG